MKKNYQKPDLGTKKYAQFENVFANCDNSSVLNCRVNPGNGGGKNETDKGESGVSSWDYAFSSAIIQS